MTATVPHRLEPACRIITEDDLQNRFTYHAPDDHRAIAAYQEIRPLGLTLASLIRELAPDCAELVRAIDAVDQAVMWANAAIARHGVRT